MEYFQRYGTIVRLDMLNKVWIIFSSPHDIEVGIDYIQRLLFYDHCTDFLIV